MSDTYLTMPCVLYVHHCQDGMDSQSSFANQFFLVIQNWDENWVPLIICPIFKDKAYKQRNQELLDFSCSPFKKLYLKEILIMEIPHHNISTSFEFYISKAPPTVPIWPNNL